MSSEGHSVATRSLPSAKELISVFESISRGSGNTKVSTKPLFKKPSYHETVDRFETVKSDKMHADLTQVAEDLEKKVSVKSLVYNFQKLSTQTPTTPSVKPRVYATPKIIDKPIPTRTVAVGPEKPTQKEVEEIQPQPVKSELFGVKPLPVAEVASSTSSDSEEDDEPSKKTYCLSTSKYTITPPQEKEVDVGDDDDGFGGSPLGIGITPLPVSYKVISGQGETLRLKLPDPPKFSCLKKKPKNGKCKVEFSEEKKFAETYSKNQYQRAVEDADYLAARAEYEIEKMLEQMDMITVNLQKTNPQEKLGLSIYGVSIQTTTEHSNTAIYVKSIMPGSKCDLNGQIQVDDLLVEVNGQSLIGVSVARVYEIIQASMPNITFLLGREPKVDREKNDCLADILTLKNFALNLTSGWPKSFQNLIFRDYASSTLIRYYIGRLSTK